MNKTSWIIVLCALTSVTAFDFVSTLTMCKQRDQEQREYGPEKGCGFAQSLTYGAIRTTIDWIDRRHDFVTAGATIVIAIFTIALWRATDRLWNAGERQLAQLSETTERQLRAYLFAHPVLLNFNIGYESTITIRYETKNWGQTPAYHIRNAAYLIKMPDPLPMNFNVESPQWDDPRHTTLGPGQSMFSDANGKYEITSEEQKYYIVGLIEYFHAFSRQKRTTKFCYYINAKEIIDARRGRSGEIPEVEFSIAPRHNEAD
jgi:hypothetical protein